MSRFAVLFIGPVCLVVAALCCGSTVTPPSTAIPPAPTATVVPFPADYSKFSIGANEFGSNFTAMTSSEVTGEIGNSTVFGTLYSQEKAMGYRGDSPAELITIVVDFLPDVSTQSDADTRLGKIDSNKIASSGSVGGPITPNGVGQTFAAYSGWSLGNDNSTKVHSDEVLYRHGKILVTLLVHYVEGSSPAATLDDVIAIINAHADAINAAP